MGQVYKYPPLAEALCELHFDPGSPWDVTIFGHYYDYIRAEFPDKRQVPQIEMSLAQREGGVTGEIRETGVRMQFVRSDGSAMVQLAPHRLVVNKLPPYESWQVFRSLILDRLADYKAIAGSIALQRVGLRYINRFDFPAEAFAVGSAFGPSDFLPGRLRLAGPPFFLRLEMSRDEDGRLLLTLGTIESEKADKVSVLLDLDYLVTDSAVLDKSTLPDSLDKAHDCIEEVFESCLTDELRQQFNQGV